MTDAIVLIVILLIVIGLVAINVLKGKPWLAALGLVVHICWYVGAIRLAKPDSWWARRYYDEDKLHRSQVRFKVEPTVPPPLPPGGVSPAVPMPS
jgi:hypothetical protein